MSEEISRNDEELQQEETLQEVTSEEEALQETVSEEEVSQEATPEEEIHQEAAAEEEQPQEEQPGEAEPAPVPTLPQVAPYHERYYLRYREGKRSVPMDLEGTKGFLQSIGFDGGELRQARKGKSFADGIWSSDTNRNHRMFCSYCGAEISGVEFHRLQDGRLRCTTCSNSIVKTKAEMEQLCRRVIANMDNFFGASIRVPVSIEIAEEQNLKKKAGIPLGVKDNQSVLILGVAINKDKKYSIILENGAPRISLIATFAHELTHIWQYTNWDQQKTFHQCPPAKRLLIYEGMAKWAEIQYLYLMGETNVARREEYITRNRQDAYGLGFCLYEERYPLSREIMSCEDTPFTPGRYPFE